MRLPLSRTRLLPLISVVTPMVLVLVVLSGAQALTSAGSPSTPIAIPAHAFRPVPSPEGAVRRILGSGGGLVRTPDGGIPDRTAEAPAASSLPAPIAGPVHVVRQGETLFQIGVWHRVDLTAVLAGNPGLDPRRLIALQRIRVPGGAPMRSITTKPLRKPSAAGRAPTRSARHLWALPIHGTITTRFSVAHPGIDIAAPSGTSVRAIAAGTVVWAGWKDNGGGYVVVIRHPDGMISTYNHNRSVAVRRGQAVAAGGRIAALGATGRATGPHLDLRIEMNGRFVDPLSFT